MDTTFLEDLTIKELIALIEACEKEIEDKRVGQKNKLMDEFNAWLERVHNAGFEVFYKDDSLLTDWDIEIAG